jgi:hypothetical protein
LESVAARAVDGNRMIIGMNTGLHGSPFRHDRSARSRGQESPASRLQPRR